MKKLRFLPVCSAILSAFLLPGCFRPFSITANPADSDRSELVETPVSGWIVPALPTLDPSAGSMTPTPDPPHDVPTPFPDNQTYTVQSGDTLSSIADLFLLDANALAAANPDIDPNWLVIGQILNIPAVTSVGAAPGFKILPDSELVFSPYTALFVLEDFIESQHGYLSSYAEIVDGVQLSGSTIVDRVAREYSVNPRLLLALLEFQSHWVTQTNIPGHLITYPMGYYDIYLDGLYQQLSWTANSLNAGYYAWESDSVSFWFLIDRSAVSVNPEVNSGTAGVQYVLSLLYGLSDWESAVGENGVYATYTSLFGSPFTFVYEPVLPEALSQPEFQLPFEQGTTWSFTGGPHAGWGEGSAWAALDFAPPGEAMGCQSSPAWVTAIADGLVTRSADGVVILDLDMDGFEQTGWTILYLHIDSQDRVKLGTRVAAGDKIGHPSCEGGYSNGTHVHIARRYNGVWVDAGGPIPFIMDGWTPSSDGVEYNGLLIKNGSSVEAWDAFVPENQISR